MFSRVLIFLLLPAFWATAQRPAAKPSYESLLERVKKGDQTVDFKELRLAYTETSGYSPYGGNTEARKAMFAALRAKEFDKVLSSAEAILAKNYVDINGHFGCFVAHRELGHTEKAAYHRFIVEGLINSIKNSGDGKAIETAFVVISTDEEYALFNWLGLRPTNQALLKENGHNYDRMTVVDPKTNQTLTYFFNIDKPFNWLGNSLKN
jgi:Domain of unknown function (DUF4919)